MQLRQWEPFYCQPLRGRCAAEYHHHLSRFCCSSIFSGVTFSSTSPSRRKRPSPSAANSSNQSPLSIKPTANEKNYSFHSDSTISLWLWGDLTQILTLTLRQ